MRAFFRLLTIIPSRPQAPQKTMRECVRACTCVYLRLTRPYSYGYSLTKKSDFSPPLQFFRGFTLPFLTVLNAPSPFVNTSPSSSEPVCFAMKGFFLHLYHALKYCWVCCIHQHTKSIGDRGGREGGGQRERERHTSEHHHISCLCLHVLLSLPPQCIKMCLHSTRINYSTNYMHIEI